MRATVKVFKVQRDRRLKPEVLEPLHVEAKSKDNLRMAAQVAVAEAHPDLVASVSFVKADQRPGRVELVAYLHDVPQRARRNVSIPGHRVRR